MDPSATPTTAGDAASNAPEVSEEDIFIAFDTYPWARDPKFMSLIENSLLKAPSTPTEARIRHARTAYFTRVLGFPFSPAAYAAFLASRPSHLPADGPLLASLVGGGDDTPAWQAAAPRAELYVDKAARAEGAGGGAGPAYPEKFAELIRCIKEGRPVPGVVEIPDTILRDPSAKPFGSRPAPRKPWEKEEPRMVVAGGVGVPPTADLEFPPLDAAAAASAEEDKTTTESPEEQRDVAKEAEAESRGRGENGTGVDPRTDLPGVEQLQLS